MYISATEWKLCQNQQDLSWFSLARQITADCRHWDLFCGRFDGRVLQGGREGGLKGLAWTTTAPSRWRWCSRRRRRPRRMPSKRRGSLKGVDLGQERRPGRKISFNLNETEWLQNIAIKVWMHLWLLGNSDSRWYQVLQQQAELRTAFKSFYASHVHRWAVE